MTKTTIMKQIAEKQRVEIEDLVMGPGVEDHEFLGLPVRTELLKRVRKAPIVTDEELVAKSDEELLDALNVLVAELRRRRGE